MAKLTLWIAVAFIALQASYGASISETHPERNSVAVFSKNSRGILDIFEQLKATIDSIIQTLTDLPSKVHEKFQEILATVNILGISRQLEREINQAIRDGGKHAEKCRPEGEENLDALIDAAQKTSKECLETANDSFSEINIEIVSLISESRALLNDFNEQVIDCMFSNILNPIGFTRCLDSHKDEYKKIIAELQNRVGNIIPESDNIILQLAECVNRLQLDTIKKGQVIIEDVEYCVRTTH